MILKSVIYILPILIIHIAYGQPDITYGQQVDIKIKADRQYSNEASDIIFNVQVKNNSFNKYYIQDTSYIQKATDIPAANYVWPYIEKKQKGKYTPGDFYRSNASLAPDSCGFYCCNCLLLRKGESIQFNVDFLSPYKLEKGEYRVFVTLHAPSSPATESGVYTEFKSNYVYFTID